MPPHSYFTNPFGVQSQIEVANDQMASCAADFANDFADAIKQGRARLADVKMFDAGVYGRAEGFVYFLGVGDPYPTHIKVGFTAGDPRKRKAALQTGCPFQICLIGFVLGNRAMERELHDVFKCSNTSGEWFEFDGNVEPTVHRILYDPAQ